MRSMNHQLKHLVGMRRALAGGATLVALLWFFAGGRLAAQDILTRGWHRFTSEEGQFSVLMPGLPEKTTMQQNNSAFGRVPIGMVYFRTEVESYVVNYTDLPSSKDIPAAKAQEEVLAGYRQSAARAGKVSETRATVSGRPATIITVVKPDGGLFKGACLFSGQRMYQILYQRSGGRPEKDLANGTAFIQSFKLVP